MFGCGLGGLGGLSPRLCQNMQGLPLFKRWHYSSDGGAFISISFLRVLRVPAFSVFTARYPGNAIPINYRAFLCAFAFSALLVQCLLFSQ